MNSTSLDFCNQNVRTALLIAAILFSCLHSNIFAATDNVKAELNKKSAWLGEPVTLIVTLYSPALFSGTATFEFPNLPKTSFMRNGSPLVGKEDIGDDEFATQRHEFLIFTQEARKITIPPFKVRFAGKETFVGETKAMEAITPELSFESKRPPGTESMGLIVSLNSFTINQKWSPAENTNFKAGDILQRTITREASNSSAMMFPDIYLQVIDGVKIIKSDPELSDKSERGISTSIRIDTIRYQFLQPRNITIGDIKFSWWNPKSEKLEEKILKGINIEVQESDLAKIETNSEVKAEDEKSWVKAILLSIAGVLILLSAFISVRRLSKKWKEYQSDPIRVLVRKLKRACEQNNRLDAYNAFLKWKDLTRSDLAQNKKITHEWNHLNQILFAEQQDTQWNGAHFWEAFLQLQTDLQKQQNNSQSELPSLNPSRFNHVSH